MPILDRADLRVDVPSGWEGEIYSRGDAGQVVAAPPSRSTGDPQAFGTASAPNGSSPAPATAGRTFVHLATFPLPADRADYGNGAVQAMGPDDIFIALLEHEREDATQPLFAPVGIPRLTAADFRTDVLHRTLEGHSGYQRFFHVGDRAFCLYIVIGSHWNRSELVPRVNQMLEGLSIG